MILGAKPFHASGRWSSIIFKVFVKNVAFECESRILALFWQPKIKNSIVLACWAFAMLKIFDKLSLIQAQWESVSSFSHTQTHTGSTNTMASSFRNRRTGTYLTFSFHGVSSHRFHPFCCWCCCCCSCSLVDSSLAWFGSEWLCVCAHRYFCVYYFTLLCSVLFHSDSAYRSFDACRSHLACVYLYLYMYITSMHVHANIESILASVYTHTHNKIHNHMQLNR